MQLVIIVTKKGKFSMLALPAMGERGVHKACARVWIYLAWSRKIFSYPSSLFFKKGLNRSIGMGKSIVELFSVAISESVCK